MRFTARIGLGLALAGALAAAPAAMAWSPDSYFYGRGGHGARGGYGFSSEESCELQPAYTQTTTVSPEEDTRTFATVRHVQKTIPRERVNVEHVYHHLNRVNHVVHDVNQDVYIKNVRVHHNVKHDQTVHHYRHHTNYIEQDVDEHVDEHETLPTRYESDCDPEGPR